jgi:hypothetical protein
MLSARRAERRAALSFLETDSLKRRLASLRRQCDDRTIGSAERASLKVHVEDYEAVLGEREEEQMSAFALARSVS